MIRSVPASPADVPEMVFPLESGADIYAIHRALEAKFGPRREAGWLWSLQRGSAGDACIVRLPGDFAAPPLSAGERWLFSLHARVAQKDGTTGRRRSWRPDETGRRLRWLERRGAEHGFAVVAAAVEAVREPVRKLKTGFWLDRSEFSGLIEIVDPEKGKAAMTAGIGGGRAWGLGMLRLLGKQEDQEPCSIS